MNNDNEKRSSRIILREMTTEDIPQVIALEKEIFSDPWPPSAFEEHLTLDGWGAFVAEKEGEVVGYACYYVVDIEGHLTNIAVHPALRRKSVARRLLERILEVVQASGCEYILLEVRPGNKEARAFYERFGFTLLYRRPYYYRHPLEDALVLVRYLKGDRKVL